MCTDGRKEALLKSWPLFLNHKTSGKKVCGFNQPGQMENSATYTRASHQGVGVPINGVKPWFRGGSPQDSSLMYFYIELDHKADGNRLIRSCRMFYL